MNITNLFRITFQIRFRFKNDHKRRENHFRLRKKIVNIFKSLYSHLFLFTFRNIS